MICGTHCMVHVQVAMNLNAPVNITISSWIRIALLLRVYVVSLYNKLMRGLRGDQHQDY